MDSTLYSEIGKSVELAQQNNASLTEQNLLYVVKVATDMAAKTGADFDMLLCEGVIAMSKYEKKYDPTKNDKFIKFVGPAVRGYMLNAINRQSSLVHIPANHMKGFKKGQERNESSVFEYVEIDSSNYDTLGEVDNNAFEIDREKILNDGLNTLDVNGRKAMEMKLRLGKWDEKIPSANDPDRLVYKYNNNLKSIAEELEVPINIANKIYKEAMSKLSKYCQTACN